MPKPPLPPMQFDNPLRSTDPERHKLVAVESPTARETAEGQGSAPTAPATALTQPRATEKSVRAQQRKLTVYISEDAAQAIDDEAYARRKAGERLSFGDLHREIVEDWYSRRAKRLRSAAS